MIVVPLESGDVLVEVRLVVELRCLLDQRLHQILRQNLRETSDVEDVLLGIERGELSAQLRKRVNDLRLRPPHSGIKRGEQPGGTAANDRDVCYLVGHRREIYSSGKVACPACWQLSMYGSRLLCDLRFGAHQVMAGPTL